MNDFYEPVKFRKEFIMNFRNELVNKSIGF